MIARKVTLVWPRIVALLCQYFGCPTASDRRKRFTEVYVQQEQYRDCLLTGIVSIQCIQSQYMGDDEKYECDAVLHAAWHSIGLPILAQPLHSISTALWPLSIGYGIAPSLPGRSDQKSRLWIPFLLECPGIWSVSFLETITFILQMPGAGEMLQAIHATGASWTQPRKGMKVSLNLSDDTSCSLMRSKHSFVCR
jgi:hypothetical protein